MPEKSAVWFEAFGTSKNHSNEASIMEHIVVNLTQVFCFFTVLFFSLQKQKRYDTLIYNVVDVSKAPVASRLHATVSVVGIDQHKSILQARLLHSPRIVVPLVSFVFPPLLIT